MPSALIIDPSAVARSYRSELRARVQKLGHPLKLVGFLAGADSPSKTYADYTRLGCEDVGITFELREVHKLALEAAIDAANADHSVHGIIVYYPIFATGHDAYIKDLVDHRKDIEGLNSYWARMLYHNRRYIDAAKTQKALLPCTPLAVVKLLEAARHAVHGAEAAPRQTSPSGPKAQSLCGQTVAIFNRSEVVGRPLASMLANDGARVYSFDVNGGLLFNGDGVHATDTARPEALAAADIIITGVPSREFPLIDAASIKSGAICINFSTLRNFADDVAHRAAIFIPRVGPMTVAMALRNTLRLYDNYHAK